ncbi:MAG: acetate kinase [Candidatus Rokuibacteriota bacterium]|nr:MAG: acetate kinase [Candidatus Rokubacteria bacterium]
MNVLAINCGSSSIKFGLFAAPASGGRAGVVRRQAGGRIERLGQDKAQLHFETDSGAPLDTAAAVPDHAEGVRRIAEWIRAIGLPVQAVGHRVVHGGPRFRTPTVLDDTVIAAIHGLETLAPLHNGPSLAGIRGCRAAFGGELPMVAVFDTAFHASLPERAWRYAIPRELADRHGIRRYGFHGISYRAALERYCALAGRPESRATIIALHLGSGCSAVAIENGRSVDTSMGLTPLEGLVMGTRSGDVDPGIVGHLSRAEEVPVAEVERWLNERSGLLGLSSRSGDLRDLLAHEHDDDRAAIAVELFCYRIRKYIGAYLAALGGAQALVFTGAIGERSAEIRARICQGLDCFGLTLDPRANAEAGGGERRISASGARLEAIVIPTDEEIEIARDTVQALHR